MVADDATARRDHDELPVVGSDQLALLGEPSGAGGRSSGEELHRADELVALLVPSDIPDERQGERRGHQGDDDAARDRHEKDPASQRPGPHDATTE